MLVVAESHIPNSTCITGRKPTVIVTASFQQVKGTRTQLQAMSVSYTNIQTEAYHAVL